MAAPTKSDGAPSRDWLYALGEKAVGATSSPSPVVVQAAPLSGRPGIEVDTIQFSDWSHFIEVPSVPIARVSTPDDVVGVCNWAAQNGYTVRAVGESHNWSPILLASQQTAAKVMLVDTTKLNSCHFAVVDGVPLATFGTGISLESATAYLETRHNHGTGAAPGYSLPHMPAPGNLTLGGMLAIGAHGTCVPSGTDEPDLMGSLSNLIMGFDAVVTDPDHPTPTTYAIRHFDRADTDAAAFLVHLGRAFITAVTLRVVPNYYLQMRCLFPDVAELFASPSGGELPAQAYSNLVDAYGRDEVLWFPFTDRGFVQCAELQSSKIEPQVPGPYNYSWMNDVTPLKSDLIAAALHADPKITPGFGETELACAQVTLTDKVLNGTARDLELYLKDTTLRVTLSGWALQIRRADVQAVASQFFQQLTSAMDTARAGGKYPVNAATEIRCTTLDRQDALGVTGAVPPTLAATHSVAPDDPTLDTVIWFNIAVVPRTLEAYQFLTDLEGWMIDTWGADQPVRFRPEWSKAWAWSIDGPWTNNARIAAFRATYNQTTEGPLTFESAAATLASYDKANLFTNPFLQTLFPS